MKANNKPQPKEANMTQKAKRDIYSMNYRRLQKIAGDLENLPSYQKLAAEPFMDLSIEKLYTDREGRTVIAMAHYYEQNGDLVPDPDMEIRIDHELQMVEALTFQSCFGFQRVYTEDEKGQTLYYPGLKKELNSFLGTWLRNIAAQGHTQKEIRA